MTELNDHDLLADFARNESGPAFAELVARHVNLVYSTALRFTGNPHHAEEITQAVFIILARKAGKLSLRVVLSGWLYQTARLTAANFMKGEIRRQNREQEAYMQSALNESAAMDWQQIAPYLDDAMGRLGETDRNAIVLRFFENKTAAEIAATLKTTEAAAHKRVNRALEKLRKIFAKRGVTLTATLIAGAVSANSVQAAPVGLAKTISAVAVAKGMAAGTSTLTLVKGALKIMAWTKAKTAIIVGAAVILSAGLGSGIYIYHFTHSALGGPAAELKSALRIPRPATGIWGYPSEKVSLAILHFGTNRAAAFPILKKAVEGSNAEARSQAIAAMGMIDRPALPRFYGQLGEPATNAVPFLRKILFGNTDLSSSALAPLHGLFEARDIPALAKLLAQSNRAGTLQKAVANVHNSKAAESVADRAEHNQQLQRYLPEAIAETIQKNPEAAAPFIPSVEDLLDDTNDDVRFGAACALAKCLGVDDPRISRELKAGLKITYDTSGPRRTPRLNPEDGLKQLMAVETLQSIGPDAKPMVPALLKFANTTKDFVMREHALAAVGYIAPNLRETMPAVDQAVKSDPTFRSTTSTKLR